MSFAFLVFLDLTKEKQHPAQGQGKPMICESQKSLTVSWSSGLSLCKAHVRASTASVLARGYVSALKLAGLASETG